MPIETESVDNEVKKQLPDVQKVGYGRHATHTMCEGSLEKHHAPRGGRILVNEKKKITRKIVSKKMKDKISAQEPNSVRRRGESGKPVFASQDQHAYPFFLDV